MFDYDSYPEREEPNVHEGVTIAAVVKAICDDPSGPYGPPSIAPGYDIVDESTLIIMKPKAGSESENV